MLLRGANKKILESDGSIPRPSLIEKCQLLDTSEDKFDKLHSRIMGMCEEDSPCGMEWVADRLPISLVL